MHVSEHLSTLVLGAVNCLVLCTEAFCQGSFVLRCYRGWGDTGPCLAPHPMHQHGLLSSWEAALWKGLRGSWRARCWPRTSSVSFRAAASGAVLGRALPAGQGLLCSCVHFWAPQSTRHGCSAGRATTIIKCLEHLLSEERLSKLGLCSLEKRKFWGFSLCLNT